MSENKWEAQCDLVVEGNDSCEQVLVLSSGSAMKYLAWHLSSYNHLLRCRALSSGLWSVMSALTAEAFSSDHLPLIPTPGAFSSQLSTQASTMPPHASMRPREASAFLQTKYSLWGTRHSILVFTGLDSALHHFYIIVPIVCWTWCKGKYKASPSNLQPLQSHNWGSGPQTSDVLGFFIVFISVLHIL